MRESLKGAIGSPNLMHHLSQCSATGLSNSKIHMLLLHRMLVYLTAMVVDMSDTQQLAEVEHLLPQAQAAFVNVLPKPAGPYTAFATNVEGHVCEEGQLKRIVFL